MAIGPAKLVRHLRLKSTKVKVRANGFNIRSILLKDIERWGWQTVSTDINICCCRTTTLDVHFNCSRGLRNHLVRTRIPNNVGNGGRGGGGQTASTSFKIRDNKRNAEQMLKQSLNAFKLIHHRFNKF